MIFDPYLAIWLNPSTDRWLMNPGMALARRQYPPPHSDSLAARSKIAFPPPPPRPVPTCRSRPILSWNSSLTYSPMVRPDGSARRKISLRTKPRVRLWYSRREPYGAGGNLEKETIINELLDCTPSVKMKIHGNVGRLLRQQQQQQQQQQQRQQQ